MTKKHNKMYKTLTFYIKNKTIQNRISENEN